MASKELILKLQKIARKKQSKELTYEEASEAADNLVGFFDLLLKIDSRNKKSSYKTTDIEEKAK
jgi:hypothetical protein